MNETQRSVTKKASDRGRDKVKHMRLNSSEIVMQDISSGKAAGVCVRVVVCVVSEWEGVKEKEESNARHPETSL